jgi:N,N-dimethylformamidase
MALIPLVGYADRWSAAPGDTIAFKISSAGDEPYRARLVRVVSGDPNPEGPGIIERDVDAAFAGTYPSRLQKIERGSYMRVKAPQPLNGLLSFTLTATIWPTTPDKGLQGVISRWQEADAVGMALAIDKDGVVAMVGAAGKHTRIDVGKPLIARRWYRIWMSFDATSGRLAVGQKPLHPAFDADDDGVEDVTIAFTPSGPRETDLLVAALSDRPTSGHFNGKIEAPTVFNRASAEAPEADPGGIIAAWDFSMEIETARVADGGRNGMDGELVNLPARAMTGSTWDGSVFHWQAKPEHYGAIHFHDDDLYDCSWQDDFTFTVPQDLRSGVYAARLTAADGAEEMIPFFVRAAKGEPQSRVCVLIPSFTYTVYANIARGNTNDDYWRRVKDWNARPWNPDQYPGFGQSTYNFHSDGSGISYSSRLRPVITMRSGYVSYSDVVGSGMRHFPADSHLWTWLDQMDVDFDVITDEDLHQDGVAAIAGYKAVMTTSHPEYHTSETLDALQSYVDGGGRFMYLGGNGFYWKVAVSDAFPGAVEIRRGEGGIRAWAADPGEYYNAFDGGYGGLWRRNGRPPQQLCGLGFTSQGDHEGSYYRRTKASFDPAHAWVFDGIDSNVVGDFGLSGGGAAGFELDRADTRLGTPLNATVLAQSERHQDHFVLVPEEILTHISTWPGETPQDLIRADIVYFDTAGGGAVFSVGSITFCGSLPCNGGDNDISKMTLNVLRRFMDD